MRHGEMTEEEAAVHPQRHILTRALGVSSDVETDMWELELAAGDRVLLCSDGLSNEVEHGRDGRILGAVADPSEAAQRLVDVANDHGGADNITVVVVDVPGRRGRTTAPAAMVTPLGSGRGPPHGGRPGDRRTRATPGGQPTRRRAKATAADDVPGGGPSRPVPRPPRRRRLDGPAAGVGRPRRRHPRPRRPARLRRRADRRSPRRGRAATSSSSAARRPRCRWPAPPPGSRRHPAEDRRRAAGEKESRGARRRRLGIPRRITSG